MDTINFEQRKLAISDKRATKALILTKIRKAIVELEPGKDYLISFDVIESLKRAEASLALELVKPNQEP